MNITSIAGKIAVPHLLPYTASKFAQVGLSDGLRAELRRENILVTTVCPGLMRTGSPRHALFKGQHRREYAWFAISDSLPVISMNAERAARNVIEACRQGKPRIDLGLHVRGVLVLNELFPNASARVLALANRMLPGTDATLSDTARPGHDSESAWAPSVLTQLSDQAALRNNEKP